MNRKIIALCAVAIALTASADETVSGTWSLQQCIDYAMDHSLQLRQKQVTVDRNEVQVEARKGALFPSLSFATNQSASWRPWSEAYYNLSDGNLNSTSSEVNYNGSYGLSANWTVWDGGRNRKQLKKSRLAKEQSEVDIESTRLSLQEQIVQIYVQILYQTEAVRVNREILANTRIQADRAKAMYEVGNMSRADYAQMEAQVSQEEYNVTNAETQLASFKLQLKQLLEIVDSPDFDVAVPEINPDNVLAILPTPADVYDMALNTRPELRYYRLGIESAEMDIDIAKRGYYPTLGMSAGINTSNMSGLDKSFGTQLKTNLNNNIGLSISIPIFDQKQNKTNVATARLARESAQIELELEEKQLRSDIETYWLNAVNAQQQFRNATTSVESMRTSYDLVSEQFAVGLKDIVDLQTGKNNLIQAEQQMLQAKYTAVLNRALLLFYQGSPLTL
ncbi:MAG: TolC family protein [Bacteroides sp.]|nr:TolC family protein [Bacteroides sp.]MCM1457122.1 TolC family protein [Lachnoclostridium sp.]